MTDQLFHREPRRMKRPRKATLYEQLANAANTIIGQQETMAQMDVQLQYAREHAQRLAAELHQAKRTKPIWRK